MNKLRQEYLISYDIADNAIRLKIYKELAAYGLNAVQKSVFWGYLTMAELESIKRLFHAKLNNFDKAFVTQTNFNSRGQSYMMGHTREEFTDWQENDVI